MKKIFVLLLSIASFYSHATTVTNLTGSYKNGQAFLTWNKVSDTTAFYKVYRSTTPITSGSQLNSCEYLGYTNSFSSVDWNLTKQDSTTRYLRIDSAGTLLTPTTGLFVATTLVNGNYYYAVTVMINNSEDQTIISGTNSISTSISETVSEPWPVFQEMRVIEGENVEIYATFLSAKYAVGQSLMNKSGFIAFDFALYRNHFMGEMQPLLIHLHGGGALFLDKITNVSTDEMVIDMEDGLPSGANVAWWGMNENYDIYNDDLNENPPTSGINYNSTEIRINRALDWAYKTIAVDTNRTYIEGTSLGAPGAYFMAITYPDRFAAVSVDGGIFDFAFENDYQTKCSFNTGKKNRINGNSRLGMIATDLPTNLGINTYELLAGGKQIHDQNEKNFPFVISLNGKHDDLMGWTEKTFYYDSVNHNHTGGYYFWDQRTHNGDGGVWNTQDNIKMYRFSKNLSFPAFSDCSLNEDWGNGDGNTGDEYGTVNGSVDWVNEVIDDATQWEAQVFVHDLTKNDGTIVSYPDSATVTITPRRIQNFNPNIGDDISWSVSHHGDVIQSGTMEYQGGLITISNVKVFKDTISLDIIIGAGSTWYADADGDGFGNPSVTLTSQYQPAGYVANHDDCNDGNGSIHPGAAEVCNQLDDNCNGQTDEGVQSTFYADNDNDNFGNASNTTLACTAPSGFVINSTDCNDGNASVHPGATEVCNQVDDNCNAQTDEGVQQTFYTDNDNDNFGNASTSTHACSAPSGYVSNNTDCNDANTSIHPGATEVCNQIDDNCNNQIDEGVQLTFYADNDNDSFGNANSSTGACSQPSNFVTDNTDCDDSNSEIHPGAFDIPNNGIDEDCNGSDALATLTSAPDPGVNHLSLYPNPAHGQFTLELNLNNQHSEVAIQILNAIGQRIYEREFETLNGMLRQEIVLGKETPDGIYLVRVIASNQEYSAQIFYQK